MFNFLAHCPHIPNFANFLSRKSSDDELRSYANFGLPVAEDDTFNAASFSNDIIGDTTDATNDAQSDATETSADESNEVPTFSFSNSIEAQKANYALFSRDQHIPPGAGKIPAWLDNLIKNHQYGRQLP